MNIVRMSAYQRAMACDKQEKQGNIWETRFPAGITINQLITRAGGKYSMETLNFVDIGVVATDVLLCIPLVLHCSFPDFRFRERLSNEKFPKIYE